MKKKLQILIAFALICVNANAQNPHFWGTLNGYCDIQGSDAVHVFETNADGTNYHSGCFGFAPNYPNTLLKASNGLLYGMANRTMYGAFDSYIFSLDPASNTFALPVHLVSQANIGQCGRSLIQATDGKLYGVAPNGGTSTNIYGAIFSYDYTSNTYSVLHIFNNTEGRNPWCTLLQASSGKMYGTTTTYGLHGVGSLFSMDVANNSFSVVHYFDSATGYCPTSGAGTAGPMVQLSNGKLYGTTNLGGANLAGVIYSFDTTTNTYADVYDFSSSAGKFPGSLIQAANGLLYGITSNGGAHGGGTVFNFDPNTNTFSHLYDFDSTIVFHPNGALLQASDEKFYGVDNHRNAFCYNATTNMATALSFQAAGDLIEDNTNTAIGCSASYNISADTIPHHYTIVSTVTGTGPIHYTWNWGDGHQDTIPYPSHTYADTGLYTICLSITSYSGCSSYFCNMHYHVSRTESTMAYVNVFNPFTVGIKNVSAQPFTVNVFPNPTNNYLSVNLSSYSIDNQLLITDVLGNVVYKQTLCCLNNTIDVSKWSNGIYFYEVRSGLQIPTSTRGKFVVQH